MSQRDDELMQLLRAELTRRDNTTPREGFDMRVQNTVRTLQRPRGGMQRFFATGAALAAVAAVVVALTVGIRTHQSRGVTSPAAPPTPTPTQVQTSGSLMVFQTMVSASHYTTTFTRGDGQVVRTVDAPGAVQGSPLVGRAMYLDDGHQGWVLHRDGSITPVNAAARADMAAAGNPLMVDDTTAVVVVPLPNGGGGRLEVVDVLTGAHRVILTAQLAPDASSSSASEVGIVGASRGWSTVYVLVRDMVVDGRLVADPVVDDVDVALAKVTRTRPLPVGKSPVAISPDGRLVAWQDAAVDAHKNLSYSVTHLTDLASGHTVDVTGAYPGLGGVVPGMLFSPDGARLMVAGNDNEATPTGIESMAEVSTADGHLLQRQQLEYQSGETLKPVGWLDADHMAYETNTNSTVNGRLVGVEVAYVVDLSGRSQPLSKSDLGSFVAVLR